jgi:alanine racemase
MGRIGFLPDKATDAAGEISSLPGISIEGIFTHFASSDDTDLSYTQEQFKIFKSAVQKIEEKCGSIPIVHCCNSGAIMAGLSEMFLDAVRPGHILHGLIPSPECGRSVRIKPCFSLKTEIGAIRKLPPGSSVSYGRTYRTSEDETIAILPIGYGDGYSRNLSGVGEVLINGKRCPIRGRVCMDQVVVGISEAPCAKVGDEVVLIGEQGGESISIEEYARKINSITGTVPTSFTNRVPKIYRD